MKAKILYIVILSFFGGSKSLASECVRLCIPFKAGIENSDLIVCGKVIGHDPLGVDTILVMDRLKGLCSDTIIVMNYPLSGGSSISLDQEMQIFLLIKDYKDGIADYRIPDCITSVLSVNSDDFTVTGNIKRVNGFICRSLIFLRSQKLPSNTIKYEKLKRIINRSNDT